MRKLVALIGSLFGLLPVVSAHCPLCTGAVILAATSAKYYGLDNSIVGLFVGAFAISLGLWIGNRLKTKYFRFQTTAIVLASFILTVGPLIFTKNDKLLLPLFLFGEAGSIFHRVYFVDKLILGSIIGGILCLITYGLHLHIKKVRGRVLFPFQGLVFTLVSLVIAGAALYFGFR